MRKCFYGSCLHTYQSYLPWKTSVRSWIRNVSMMTSAKATNPRITASTSCPGPSFTGKYWTTTVFKKIMVWSILLWWNTENWAISCIQFNQKVWDHRMQHNDTWHKKLCFNQKAFSMQLSRIMDSGGKQIDTKWLIHDYIKGSRCYFGLQSSNNFSIIKNLNVSSFIY